MPQLSLHTPIGPITVSAEAGAIVALDWGWGRDQNPSPLLLRAKAWLHAYFEAEIAPMALPLAPVGTAYQRRIWSVIGLIALGESWSVGLVAERAGCSPRTVRAALVGNPIPILIPGHRITTGGSKRPPEPGQDLRRDVKRSWSAGGEEIETRAFLLDLERRATAVGPCASPDAPKDEAELWRNRANG